MALQHLRAAVLTTIGTLIQVKNDVIQKAIETI
jgi:hypothetical protein